MREQAQVRADHKVFWEHVAVFGMINFMAATLKYTTWPALPFWDLWVPLGWGLAVVLHGLWAYGRLG